jgi:hypothetical protein
MFALLMSGETEKPTLVGPVGGMNFYLVTKVEPAFKMLCLLAKKLDDGKCPA